MQKKRLSTDKIIEPEAFTNELKRMFPENSIMEEQMGDTTVFVVEKYFFRKNHHLH